MAEETVLSPSTLGCLHPYPIQNTCWSFFTILPKRHHWRVDFLLLTKQISQYHPVSKKHFVFGWQMPLWKPRSMAHTILRVCPWGNLRCDLLVGDGSPASALHPAALYYLAWADKRSAPTKGPSPSASFPWTKGSASKANLRISEAALHFNWMSWKCKIQAPNANLVTLGFCAQRYIKATSLANMLNPC